MGGWPVIAAMLIATAAQDKDRGSKSEPPAEKKCCIKGVAQPWDAYNEGVVWTQPPEKAYAKAREENKTLLVYYLVGDLDKEGC